MNASTPTDTPTDQRLIVALDVPKVSLAKELVDQLGEACGFYKLGLELCMSGEYFALLNWLQDRGKRVFADLKFYDVPATVGRSVAGLAQHGVDFLTVHGDRQIMRAAADNKADAKVLAVTVLTSLDQQDLLSMGYTASLTELILSRANDALAAGCDGVIASGQEAALLRKELGRDALIVTPGIRLGASDDDQKRVVTPAEAILNGADHIVVGRPIRDADDRRAMAQAIQADIVGANV